MSELIVAPVIIPVQARSVAFTSCATFMEYVSSAAPEIANLLRQRRSEVRFHTGDQQFFVDYPDVLNLIVLVSDDAPDTPVILPLIERIAGLGARADLRVITDDSLSILESLLDAEAGVDLDTLDLPQLFIFDADLQLQAQWARCPQAVESYVDGWLSTHPRYEALIDSDDPAKRAEFVRLNLQLTLLMRVWFNSGIDHECTNEIRTLLAGLQEEDEELADTEVNEQKMNRQNGIFGMLQSSVRRTWIAGILLARGAITRPRCRSKEHQFTGTPYDPILPAPELEGTNWMGNPSPSAIYVARWCCSFSVTRSVRMCAP